MASVDPPVCHGHSMTLVTHGFSWSGEFEVVSATWRCDTCPSTAETTVREWDGGPQAVRARQEAAR